MLTNTLDTQIKNATGTSVPFERVRTEGGLTRFKNVLAPNNAEADFVISHQEIGVGIKRVQKSVVRFNLTGSSDIDVGSLGVTSSWIVLNHPLGLFLTDDQAKAVLAMLGSFVFTANGTTMLLNGTGNGAAALINGTH